MKTTYHFCAFYQIGGNLSYCDGVATIAGSDFTFEEYRRLKERIVKEFALPVDHTKLVISSLSVLGTTP